MPHVQGVVICVDYADCLNLVLASNMRFLADCLVVTAPHDEETMALCASIPNVRTYVTDEFYRDGAKFNKGRAMNTALIEHIDHNHPFLILDADILLPDGVSFDNLDPDFLYGSKRRILQDPFAYRHGMDWSHLPIRQDNNRCIGFFQYAHPQSRFLRNHRPWYDQTFIHAGGGDGYFEWLFHADYRRLLPHPVLHIGPCDSNWFGRCTRKLDGTIPDNAADRSSQMEQLITAKGWAGRRRQGDIVEKIESPEIVQTGFECR